MTTPRPPRPEPTTGTPYDTYLMPRSKTPAKDELLLFLARMKWRFDTVRAEWHTPEAAPFQAHGRLEYDPDLTWARVQAPSIGDQRGPVLLELQYYDLDAFVGWDIKRPVVD